METKWTLGPWRYDRTNGSPTTGQHMIAGGKPGYLAEARDCGSGDVIANAHLIAAAPDLYAALEMAQLWLSVDGRFDMQGINAALAKARGETK